MSYLKVQNLSKCFFPAVGFRNLLKPGPKKQKSVPALRDISFSVNKGETLVILGSNGAGKTTLLKILSTIILAEEGQININGWSPNKDDDKIKSLLGLVFPQERSFYWRLTGKQNLEFFAAMHGLDQKTTSARIQELMETFKIDPSTQNRRFDVYSTGIKQKFALIRALLNSPELLLLDEPTRSLDYNTAITLRNYIKHSLQQKTVIIATHNLEEAEYLGEQFLILQQGRPLAQGSLQDLKDKVNKPHATLGDIFLTLTKNNQL